MKLSQLRQIIKEQLNNSNKINLYLSAITFLSNEFNDPYVLKQGFTNTGIGLIDENQNETFKFIIDNKDIFETIINDCGWYVENDQWDYEETIFAKR
jgi:hypothetical protein